MLLAGVKLMVIWSYQKYRGICIKYIYYFL